MIEAASCLHVKRNVATPGGTRAAISAINSSAIGPGPLGIADTSPTADAPHSTAMRASSRLAMQQIFTRGRSGMKGFTSLLLQLDDGRARSALVVGGEVEALDVRVRAQEFGDGAAKCARAVAVDDAYVGVAVQICFVQKFINVVARLVRGLADEVEFGVHALARVSEFHLRALLLRSEEHTSELQSRQYLVCRLLLEKKKQ